MPSETPIKCILISGVQIFTVDQADIAYLQCVGSSVDNARWVAWSLGQAHGVEVIPAGGILTMKMDDSGKGAPQLSPIEVGEAREPEPRDPGSYPDGVHAEITDVELLPDGHPRDNMELKLAEYSDPLPEKRD